MKRLFNRADRVVDDLLLGLVAFLSALEMGGVSLSVLDLDVTRLARLDAPTLAPAWLDAAPRTRVEPARQTIREPERSRSRTNPIDPETGSAKQLGGKCPGRPTP